MYDVSVCLYVYVPLCLFYNSLHVLITAEVPFVLLFNYADVIVLAIVVVTLVVIILLVCVCVVVVIVVVVLPLAYCNFKLQKALKTMRSPFFCALLCFCVFFFFWFFAFVFIYTKFVSMTPAKLFMNTNIACECVLYIFTHTNAGTFKRLQQQQEI